VLGAWLVVQRLVLIKHRLEQAEVFCFLLLQICLFKVRIWVALMVDLLTFLICKLIFSVGWCLILINQLLLKWLRTVTVPQRSWNSLRLLSDLAWWGCAAVLETICHFSKVVLLLHWLIVNLCAALLLLILDSFAVSISRAERTTSLLVLSWTVVKTSLFASVALFTCRIVSVDLFCQLSFKLLKVVKYFLHLHNYVQVWLGSSVSAL